MGRAAPVADVAENTSNPFEGVQNSDRLAVRIYRMPGRSYLPPPIEWYEGLDVEQAIAERFGGGVYKAEYTVSGQVHTTTNHTIDSSIRPTGAAQVSFRPTSPAPTVSPFLGQFNAQMGGPEPADEVGMLRAELRKMREDQAREREQAKFDALQKEMADLKAMLQGGAAGNALTVEKLLGLLPNLVTVFRSTNSDPVDKVVGLAMKLRALESGRGSGGDETGTASAEAELVNAIMNSSVGQIIAERILAGSNKEETKKLPPPRPPAATPRPPAASSVPTVPQATPPTPAIPAASPQALSEPSPLFKVALPHIAEGLMTMIAAGSADPQAFVEELLTQLDPVVVGEELQRYKPGQLVALILREQPALSPHQVIIGMVEGAVRQACIEAAEDGEEDPEEETTTVGGRSASDASAPAGTPVVTNGSAGGAGDKSTESPAPKRKRKEAAA